MQLDCKPDFERACTHWHAVWNHDIIDRPCTLVTARKTDVTGRFWGMAPVDGDLEQIVAEFDGVLAGHAFLGEAMPAFRPGFGPDQMAAFVGAPLTVSQDSDDTSWSEKIVDDWDAFLPLEIDDNNYYWQRMTQFHAIAAEHFKGRCLLAEIDMHSNIDLLEGLRGAQRLLFDMIDTPDTIERAMLQARALFTRVSDRFDEFGDKQSLGTTCALPMYDRGRYNRIQADFIALLNPALFRRFVLPALVEEARSLNRSCFHLDGPDALKHLDDILAIEEIDAVQWVSGAGSSPQLEWPEVLHKIQAADKIILLHLSVEEVRRIHGTYRPELLVYDVQADSVDEGQKLLQWLTKNT
jgi:hypothetical protein